MEVLWLLDPNHALKFQNLHIFQAIESPIIFQSHAILNRFGLIFHPLFWRAFIHSSQYRSISVAWRNFSLELLELFFKVFLSLKEDLSLLQSTYSRLFLVALKLTHQLHLLIELWSQDLLDLVFSSPIIAFKLEDH